MVKKATTRQAANAPKDYKTLSTEDLEKISLTELCDSDEFDFDVGDAARNRAYACLSKIADAVGSTMGPGGRNFGHNRIMSNYQYGSSLTKDGITVLRAMKFRGYETHNTKANKQIALMKAVHQYCSIASATSVLNAGDGTTGTVVLGKLVAKNIIEYCDKNTMNLQAYARRIEKQAGDAIDEIQKEAIRGGEVLRRVAMTSSNSDEELTDVVMQSVKDATAFSAFVTTKSPLAKERYAIERSDGYSGTMGYAENDSLARSFSEKTMEMAPVISENPYVAMFNGSIVTAKHAESLIDGWWRLCKFHGTERDLIVVCYGFSEEAAFKAFESNKKLQEGGKDNRVIFVKTKLSSEYKAGTQILSDLASYTGVDSNYIIDASSVKMIGQRVRVEGTNKTEPVMTLEETAKFYGTAKQAKLTPLTTIFLGRADNHWVEKRCEQNKKLIENERAGQDDKEATSLRNGELADGLVTVIIGGGQLPDLEEREARFDDAAKAVISCMKDGALPGCGLSYARAGRLANVDEPLQNALDSIHQMVARVNYGAEGVKTGEELAELEAGVSCVLKGDTAQYGPWKEVDVLDSATTVKNVIYNGVMLGLKIALIGGFFFDTKQQADI